MSGNFAIDRLEADWGQRPSVVNDWWVDPKGLPYDWDTLERHIRELPENKIFIRELNGSMGSDAAERTQAGEPSWLKPRLHRSNPPMHVHAIDVNLYDPFYKRFLDQFISAIEYFIGGRSQLHHAGMGWFLSSPNSVVPYHADREHNFLLHLMGEKTMHVYPNDDLELLTLESREQLAAKGAHLLDYYEPSFEDRAHLHHLRPGVSTYQAPLCPHWVKTHAGQPALSIYISIMTKAEMRRQAAYSVNYRLRRLGMNPGLVGERPRRDAIKGYSASWLRTLWRSLKRTRHGY